MANNGINKGRTLRAAISRFAAMLIEEARDISGYSYPELDEKFGFSIGTCQSYSKYPMRKKTRAPQADEIQNLENLVAKLNKRPPHIVIIESNAGQKSLWKPFDNLGPPDLGLNLRDLSEFDIQLGYEGDWPTYRRLKYAWNFREDVPPLLDLYAWQWGIFWDAGTLADPWTRKAQRLPEDTPVEAFLPILVERAKIERQLLGQQALIRAGILPGSQEDLRMFEDRTVDEIFPLDLDDW